MKKLLGIILSVFVLSSCASWKLENLSKYNSTNLNKFVVYTENTNNYEYLLDIENIEKNLRVYLEEKLGLELNDEIITLAILPLDNEVIDFEKQKSTATSSPSKQVILLADFYHVSDDISALYGEPPKDILITAFTHELTHCLTLWQNKFGFSGKMEESFAVFTSYIDFRDEKYRCFTTNSDLQDDIKANYTEERIESLLSNNLENIETKKTMELEIFITYLHLTGKYDYIKELLFCKNMKAFITKVNWTIADTQDFIDWIKRAQI